MGTMAGVVHAAGGAAGTAPATAGAGSIAGAAAARMVATAGALVLLTSLLLPLLAGIASTTAFSCCCCCCGWPLRLPPGFSKLGLGILLLPARWLVAPAPFVDPAHEPLLLEVPRLDERVDVQLAAPRPHGRLQLRGAA